MTTPTTDMNATAHESRASAVDAPVERQQLSLHRANRAGNGKQQRDRPSISMVIKRKDRKKA